MAENFNLVFGSQAPTTASWSDADYQTGWNVVGSTPPTAEQFDALQNRSDKKAQELNNRMLPLEQKAEEQGRQAGTAYTAGAAVTVDGLPADWLLVCTTPGTSGTVAITLPDQLLDGATINDGTITWTLRKIATNGSLGYRQPSTVYAVGQIAYHSALPTGYYLECTTQGTTSAGEITPSSTIGGTVTDGTAVWTIMKDLSLGGGVMVAGDITRYNNTGFLRFCGGISYEEGAHLLLAGDSRLDNPGTFMLVAKGQNSIPMYLTGRPNGALAWDGHDLAGSAIVAKSFGTNGYIKYASGLILQWGLDAVSNLTKTTVGGWTRYKKSFPLTMSKCVFANAAPSTLSGAGENISGFYGFAMEDSTTNWIMTFSSGNSQLPSMESHTSYICFIAIGY